MRQTPFELVFAELAAARFAEIPNEPDRDRFVLLEPVGRLLRELVPEAAGADAIEGHALLLHHAYRHWASGGWVYRIGEHALQRALADTTLTSQPPQPALYLQLPELRVWGTPTAGGGGPTEPLDGVFVSQAPEPGGIAALGIFGMRPDRPGFSAVGLEGRADSDDATASEIEIAAAREDGTPPFGPKLAGGSAAGLYSLANPGELLLLTCRLLTVLPPGEHVATRTPEDAMERVVVVE